MIKKALVVLSGGLDSSVVLHHVHKNLGYDKIQTLGFYYGQKHSFELNNAQSQTAKIGASYKQLDISFLKDVTQISSLTNDQLDIPKMKDILGDPQPTTYVPFRNMMMLSIACACAENYGAEKVFYGAAEIDTVSGYWDASEEFWLWMNKVTSLNRRNQISIEAPLIKLSKKEIIELGIKCGIDFKDTRTCYSKNILSCGECPSCSSRIKGFIDAGYIDPVSYSKTINWEKYNCKPIV